MDTIKLWARNGDAVRQAIELGELVHLDTASEELTDAFLLFAIQSRLLSKWSASFPDPRCGPEIGMEVVLASHLAARFAGLYSMRKSGYILRSASVLGALGYSQARYSEIVFYMLTVVLSYSLYHLFANTKAGARFADKTRQALTFEQLRSRRTHIIAYAGGHFEIFETLSFVHFVLQLPAAVQEQLRHWLDDHLLTVQQRK